MSPIGPIKRKGGTPMARFTRQAIMEVFKREIADRPLRQISVTDLVKACGINRNTFYYYFHDIYALASAVLDETLAEVLAPLAPSARFSDLFRCLTQYAERNRRLVCHIYGTDPALFEEHLHRAVCRQILARLRSDAETADCPARTAEQLAAFYTYAIAGSLLQWINRGMRASDAEELARMHALLDGSPRLLLLHCRAQTDKPQTIAG